MAKRIVTISYTGLDAGGGVPKFNRDLHAAFPDRTCVHFCWEHFPWQREVDARGETEWGRARMLNEHLVRSRLISSDDVVVADGFWAAGLEHFPLAISHSHGIWSHLTYEDVIAGKPPDMPAHHAAQVAFRQRWSFLGKPLTSVSAFISNELKRQWGIEVDRTINNGVDTMLYLPATAPWSRRVSRTRPLILHGVNDRFNSNKGWDHIQLLMESVDADVMSLDEAYAQFAFRSDRIWTKPEVLAQADLFVHPSGYEGNSMMVAEALSCGIPFVGYNVGLMWWLSCSLQYPDRIGAIMDRSLRCPQTTLQWTQFVLNRIAEIEPEANWMGANSRKVALIHCSIDGFRAQWREYIHLLEENHDA